MRGDKHDGKFGAGPPSPRIGRCVDAESGLSRTAVTVRPDRGSECETNTGLLLYFENAPAGPRSRYVLI